MVLPWTTSAARLCEKRMQTIRKSRIAVGMEITIEDIKISNIAVEFKKLKTVNKRRGAGETKSLIDFTPSKRCMSGAWTTSMEWSLHTHCLQGWERLLYIVINCERGNRC